MSLIESTLYPEAAVFRHVIPAGEPYLFEVKAGQTLRLLDLEGNQAVDTLFFSARNPRERYDPQRTLRKQNSVYLTTGTVLWSNLGNPLLTITADTCGRHDTIGGACSRESNTLRYGQHTRHQHACVENFLQAHAGHRCGGRDMGKRDMVSNINWFMNVPVEADGTLGIVDGISAPGKHLDLRAEMDTLVVVSNCPQINNPCNGFDPTPVRMIVTAP